MGKFADYIQKAYKTDYASFIPNYYRLYYGTNSSKEKFCLACKECIEKGEKFVNMYNAKTQFTNNLFYLCVECAKECAEIHDMKIADY